MPKSLTIKRKTEVGKPPKNIKNAKEDNSGDTSEGELSLSDETHTISAVDDDNSSSSESDESLNDNENNKQKIMGSQSMEKDRKKKAKLDKPEVIKKVSMTAVRTSDTSSDSEEGSLSDVEHGMSDDASDIEDKDTQPDVDSESDSDTVNQEDNHRKKQRVTTDSANDDDDDTGMAANDDDDDTGMAANDDDDDDDDDMDDEDAGGAETGDIIANEYSALRKELADISFEDLLKIKEKVGVKAFNKIMHGNMEEAPTEKTFKRDNKHRPRELSSKRPLPGLKHRLKTKTRTARDPRFDDLSGEFKEHHFNKNYSFIEDIKETEKATVSKKMKREKNDEKKQELKSLLGRMQQEQQVNAMKKKKLDLEKTYREKEKELVLGGKTPYFLKKSDKKTLELAMKFKELKQAGRLDKYMSKKRKKVAQKQRKKMPSKPN